MNSSPKRCSNSWTVLVKPLDTVGSPVLDADTPGFQGDPYADVLEPEDSEAPVSSSLTRLSTPPTGTMPEAPLPDLATTTADKPAPPTAPALPLKRKKSFMIDILLVPLLTAC